MSIDLQSYEDFCTRLAKIDFFGRDSGLLPTVRRTAELATKIDMGTAFVPPLYKQSYAASLGTAFPDLLRQLGGTPTAQAVAELEPFCAPIYQHAKGVTRTKVTPELQRFLAVISNLYRSFLNSNKRLAVGMPVLATEIPPLAFFQSNGDQGPYTITSESMERVLGTPVCVVSLPGSYRQHPIIWASLTHEVCGHDVAHADRDLIPELVAGVRSMFNATSFPADAALTGDRLSALVWSYWIDEAVADVYGLLNMGPTFPFNLGAFFSALTNRGFRDQGVRPPPLTSLRTTSGPDRAGKMDEHPTDILRLHLAIGVIESLTSLSSPVRQTYVNDVEAVAQLAANGAGVVELNGLVEVSHDDWRPVNARIPLADAQATAKRVGAFIATAQLSALGGKSIQDIETWDDTDEETATKISRQILNGQSIVAQGDDAQLLAGSTIAVLAQPNLYDATTGLLNAALDDSYERDPIWAGLMFDRMLAPSFFAAMTAAKPVRKQRGRDKPQA